MKVKAMCDLFILNGKNDGGKKTKPTTWKLFSLISLKIKHSSNLIETVFWGIAEINPCRWYSHYSSVLYLLV